MEPTSSNDSDGLADGISERYRQATVGVAGPSAGPLEYLPVRLALVARQVLSVDGVGISIFSDDFRLPLGASDEDAQTAEQLQFTARQGPCWDAIRQDIPVVANSDLILDRWPEFGDELRARTPYRSVVSVPLRLARNAGGAVDLYFRRHTGAGDFDPGDAIAVSAHIATVLNVATDDTPTGSVDDANTGPKWARGPAASSRNAVWIAVGMLVGQGSQNTDDAMTLLRAAAYSEGRTLDELAADLVIGRTSPQQYLDQPDDIGG